MSSAWPPPDAIAKSDRTKWLLKQRKLEDDGKNVFFVTWYETHILSRAQQQALLPGQGVAQLLRVGVNVHRQLLPSAQGKLRCCRVQNAFRSTKTVLKKIAVRGCTHVYCWHQLPVVPLYRIIITDF